MTKKAIKLGVVMDPPSQLDTKSDVTTFLLSIAQQKGWQLNYIGMNQLSIEQTRPCALIQSIKLVGTQQLHYQLGINKKIHLNELDMIWIRTDPPLTMDYMYMTQILELAEQEGCIVINRPQSLRDFNEKLLALKFYRFCPPTLISASQSQLKSFIAQYPDVMAKSINGMGGRSIFHIKPKDDNLNVILEMLTDYDSRLALVQKYLPIHELGDKRIYIIGGKPYERVFKRFPDPNDVRSNTRVGGRRIGAANIELSPQDRAICTEMAPFLMENGLFFVGLDIIGDYLIEVNITSLGFPPCELAGKVRFAHFLLDYFSSLIT